MLYRLLSGKHGRHEDGEHVIYRAGDLIDLGEHELDTLAGRIEPAEAAQGPPPAEDSPAGSKDAGGGASRSWPDGLPSQAVAGLEGAGVSPADADGMSDDELLAVSGVGPASVAVLRGR